MTAPPLPPCPVKPGPPPVRCDYCCAAPYAPCRIVNPVATEGPATYGWNGPFHAARIRESRRVAGGRK